MFTSGLFCETLAPICSGISLETTFTHRSSHSRRASGSGCQTSGCVECLDHRKLEAANDVLPALSCLPGCAQFTGPYRGREAVALEAGRYLLGCMVEPSRTKTGEQLLGASEVIAARQAGSAKVKEICWSNGKNAVGWGLMVSCAAWITALTTEDCLR